MKRLESCFSALVCLTTLMLAGCHVTSVKNGDKKNVDIGTPFGSMQVKTDDDARNANVGISVYPGATPEKKKSGSDSDAADVNLNFGSFHLGVKAVSYVTADEPDKVLAFYKKDLAKYGAVLQCDGRNPVGQPTRTAEGLTCSDDEKGVHWDIGDGPHDVPVKTELRTGSKVHQHIVGIEKHDGGSKIGLVALDLPDELMKDGDGKTSN